MRDTRRIRRSMGGGKEDITRICGDGLFLKLDSNDHVLEITGDGCKITMAKNCGSVRVVGDGCRLNITQNEGDIEYTGDGGRVCIGPKSSKDNVRYIGTGGRVTVDSYLRKTSLKNRENTSQRVEKFCDEISGEKIAAGSLNEKRSISEMENLLNEQKEEKQTQQDSNKKYNENGRKSEKIAEKVVTTIRCDGHHLVKRWFVSPGSVIQSYDGNTCTRTVSGYTKPESEVKCPEFRSIKQNI